MYQNNWLKCHKSVCGIVFYGKSGARLSAFTGFRTGDRILTDNMVHMLDEVVEVRLNFYNSDGYTKNKEIKYDIKEFRNVLSLKKTYNKYGLTVINCGAEVLEGVPEVVFCNSCQETIGRESFYIAYQFLYDNMGISPTMVSSYTKNKNGISFLLYDGTIKPGGSGAPLFDKDSGKLIGVISNKELSIVSTYKEMLKKSDENLKMLEGAKGKMMLDDIDIIQVIMAWQSQLKYMTKEFFGNFNLKSGYALELGHIKEMLETDDELDFEN